MLSSLRHALGDAILIQFSVSKEFYVDLCGRGDLFNKRVTTADLLLPGTIENEDA